MVMNLYNSTRCDDTVNPTTDVPYEGNMPKETYDMFIFVNCGILWVTLSVVGIVTNSTNLIVFRRMGFSDTVNISLFALALSDLLASIFLGWDGVWLSPYWRNVDLPFKHWEIGHLFGGWPHMMCIRTTGWITALVSFERFLCIARPLEVKMIFTPLRVKITIAVIYIGNIVPPLAIIAYTHRLVWNSVDNGTSTFLSIAYSPDREEIEGISNIFTQNIFPLLTFIMVAVPTVGLVIKLSEKKKWRDSATSTAESSKTSDNSKDSRAAKMVTFVSVIYIICFTPTIIGFVVWVMFPTDFHWTGRLFDVFLVSFSFMFIFHGFNANVNFFIYYRMSSRFRKTFRGMIGAKD